MAARRKPPVKKIKFELTRSGIAGVGVVCFCIFLWMFLLGVWTGQTLLLPPVNNGADIAKRAAGNSPSDPPLRITAGAGKKKLKMDN